MDYKLLSTALVLLVLRAECQISNGGVENSTSQLSLIEGTLRKGRALTSLAYASLISCAVRYDTVCLVDAAGELFDLKKNELLAQADLDAFRATGRADPDNTPSQVAKTIEHLISQLSGLFRNTMYTLLSAKEGDSDDEVIDVDDNDDGSGRGVNGERTVKKKNKMGGMAQLMTIGAAIKGIIELILKLYSAAVLTKIFLVLLSSLFLNTAKLVIGFKKGSEPSKAIYYEHSQHDHHYDADPWAHSEEGGSFWGR